MNNLQLALSQGNEAIEAYLGDVTTADFIKDITCLKSPSVSLEHAAITLASGMVHGVWEDGLPLRQLDLIKDNAVILAKAIIEECNK